MNHSSEYNDLYSRFVFRRNDEMPAVINYQAYSDEIEGYLVLKEHDHILLQAQIDELKKDNSELKKEVASLRKRDSEDLAPLVYQLTKENKSLRENSGSDVELVNQLLRDVGVWQSKYNALEAEFKALKKELETPQR